MCCSLDYTVSLSSVESLCFLFSIPDLKNLLTACGIWLREIFIPISYNSDTQFIYLLVFNYIKTFEVNFHTSCNNFSFGTFHTPSAMSHPLLTYVFHQSFLKSESKYSGSFQTFPPALCFLNNNHNPLFFLIFLFCYIYMLLDILNIFHCLYIKNSLLFSLICFVRAWLLGILSLSLCFLSFHQLLPSLRALFLASCHH